MGSFFVSFFRLSVDVRKRNRPGFPNPGLLNCLFGLSTLSFQLELQIPDTAPYL